jgi:hypothetical protein
MAVATPMQNVTKRVARKSTTMRRVLDLPLEASMTDSLLVLSGPAFRP